MNFSDPFGLCPPRDDNKADCTVHLNGATLSNAGFRSDLEAFARFLGRDLEMNGGASGDRSESDVKSLQTSSRSPHLDNVAADFHVAGMSNLEVAHGAAKSDLFSGVELSLGITGKARRGAHVHVDEAKRHYIWTEDHKGKFTPGLPPLPDKEK